MFTAGVTAAAAGVTALGTAAVNSYADFEQLKGGIETLFGTGGIATVQEYADSVGKTVDEVQSEFDMLMEAQELAMTNAANAYKDAGLSANEYMSTVTSFAASLKSSTENELEAAEVANQAVIDMADNANKMGTSMELIQNAYQGFAKQNYTMLDNLKLGYGGTKTEMERLLADAEKLTGIKYDINNLNDVYSAIHAIQDELGITGTTANEAATTISGSASAMKAAWSNLLTGMADDTQDFDTLVNNFVESASTFAGNVMPRVITAIGGIGQLIESMLPVIINEIPTLINDVLPDLLQSGINMITALLNGIQQNLPQIARGAVQIMSTLINSFVALLPQMLEMGLQIIIELALGISEALPELIPTIVDVLLEMVNTLVDNIDMLADAAIQLLQGLADGLINALPVLIERLPEIIMNIVSTLIEYAPQLIDAAQAVIMTLAEGIVTYLPQLLEMLPSLISSIVIALVENAPQLIEAALEFITTITQALFTYLPELLAALPELVVALVNEFIALAGKLYEIGSKYVAEIKDAIKQKWEDLKSNVSGWVTELVNKFGEFVGNFFSIGENIVSGIWNGIQAGWDWLVQSVKDLANSLFGAAQEALDIHSPSRKFKWLAEMCVAGFDEGMDELMDPVALTNSINASLSTMSANMSGGSAGGTTGGFGSFNQTINVNQQISTPDELARAVRVESRYGLMRGVAVG